MCFRPNKPCHAKPICGDQDKTKGEEQQARGIHSKMTLYSAASKQPPRPTVTQNIQKIPLYHTAATASQQIAHVQAGSNQN